MHVWGRQPEACAEKLIGKILILALTPTSKVEILTISHALFTTCPPVSLSSCTGT